MVSTIRRIDRNHRRSRAVVHNGLVYTAGQVPHDMDQDATGQTEQVLAKIDELLEAAGTNRSNVLSAQVWLSSRDDLAAMNAVWDAWVDADNPPARICGMVAMNNPKCRVEIQVIAAAD